MNGINDSLEDIRLKEAGRRSWLNRKFEKPAIRTTREYAGNAAATSERTFRMSHWEFWFALALFLLFLVIVSLMFADMGSEFRLIAFVSFSAFFLITQLPNLIRMARNRRIELDEQGISYAGQNWNWSYIRETALFFPDEDSTRDALLILVLADGNYDRIPLEHFGGFMQNFPKRLAAEIEGLKPTQS